MEKDAFYFPHFDKARNDRKLKRAQKELGIEGYAIFFMVLEVLRGEENFKYPLEDIDLLADEFGSSEPKVRTLVCNYELFKNDDKFFWSEKLIEYLMPYLEQKKKRSIDGIKGNLVKYGYINKARLSKMTDLQVVEFNKNRYDSHPTRGAIAKRVKEKKVEEKKIEIYKEFDHLKISIVEFKKLKEKFTEAEIDSVLDSIENYKKNKNYKSLYLTARNWLNKRASNQNSNSGKYPPPLNDQRWKTKITMPSVSTGLEMSGLEFIEIMKQRKDKVWDVIQMKLGA